MSEKTFLENFKPIKYYGWFGKYSFWQLYFFWSLAHCVLTYLLHDIPEKVPHWKCNRHGPYRRSEIWIGDDVLHHHDYWIGQDQGQILKIEQIDTTILLYQIVLTRKFFLTLLFLIYYRQKAYHFEKDFRKDSRLVIIGNYRKELVIL